MTTSINLLPVTYLRRQLVRTRCAQWSLGMFIALGFVAVDYTRAVKEYQSALHDVEPLQRRNKHMETQKAELARLEAILFDLSAPGLPELDPDGTNSVPSLLGIVSQSAQICAGRLWIEKLLLTTGKDKAATGNALRRLTLEGKALDNLAAATFVATLRDTDLFDRVDLKTSSAGPGIESARSYVVECLF